MTQKTKRLLLNTIEEYRKMSIGQRVRGIDQIRNCLKKHDNGLDVIGFGFDPCMVNAGRIFLRIFENKKL